jgi:DMSO/TMAO reductase YedYZ molybdopterin-dependent catalytic subunit
MTFENGWSRRRFLGGAATVGLAGASWTAWAADPLPAPTGGALKSGGDVPPGAPTPSDTPEPTPAPDAAGDTATPEPPAPPPPPPPEPTTATLPMEGGPKDRPLTKDFPQKGTMVLQSTRPPVLETPFQVFDKGVITPNDRFYVSWHSGAIPTSIDPNIFRLSVHGNVKQPVSLSLSDIKSLPKVEITAIDQAPGNSRGMFMPRVPGVQWGNGAIGNAKWTGVRLKDILDKAGILPGTIRVRFKGAEKPSGPGVPDYMKSLDLAHAINGEVIVAFAMNGAPLPVLNGFPLRLIVPGWYACYWVQMLNDIELLTVPDDNYWTVSADLVPATLRGSVDPGDSGYAMRPITRMVPRSFITNIQVGEKLAPDTTAIVRGIAMGGDTGVARVEFSSDGGQNWTTAKLEKDFGQYSFRRWQARFKPKAGSATLMSRCTNTYGVTQPKVASWNPAGIMRDGVEPVQVTVGDDDAPTDQ